MTSELHLSFSASRGKTRRAKNSILPKVTDFGQSETAGLSGSADLYFGLTKSTQQAPINPKRLLTIKKIISASRAPICDKLHNKKPSDSNKTSIIIKLFIFFTPFKLFSDLFL